ncbi:oligoendopeptidase F [Deinococcus cellulosilyticus]|uniref:Oligopeptidase F n=1 Tax=Deinococcus cellulosilyticus (strain DSM 18568 / NBRC 106333 / KACC 11606 / 5516J-15) TaxID=1223518 RepID=A0A511N7M0_DEIC1|nr:oligoendopeptidase F [Deinococcus cellulosilyticus]GEM48478.1 oligoendopeptidase F [Deinococcus cellulosilyticus NBRC 106333 = KACC 11606]
MTTSVHRERWDIQSIFADFEAWDEEFQQVSSEIQTLVAFRGTLTRDPGQLSAFLNAWNELSVRVNRLGIYTTMKISVDTTDTESRRKQSESQALSAAFQSELAFVEPELLTLPEETARNWLEKHPDLKVYQTYFERLWTQKQALRSAEVEALLGSVSEAFQSAKGIHPTLVNELDFGSIETPQGTVKLAHNTLQTLVSHPDRHVRKAAWEQYARKHLEVQQTMAAAVTTGVKQNVFLARIRGFSSSLAAALYPNRLPEAVYHNFMQVFERHRSLWHRYWRIRKKALNLPDFAEYDIRAPLTERSPVVTYEQVVDFITAGMRPLGQDYVKVMRSGLLEQRWVDYALTPHRRQGAFSIGNSLTKPFIFMSFQESLYGMSTLAHEVGHSMHKYLSNQAQPIVYEKYTLFAAEVASNFNQAMTRAYLLKTVQEREFRIAVLEEAFYNFHRYFLVMPVLSQFELTLHQQAEQGKTFGAAQMNRLMCELLAEVYGGEVQLDESLNGIMWSQFSTHLYANFYTWQYGTGIAAANALADRVLSGEEGAVENYLEFLSLGGKLPPLEALKIAGVDMSTPEPIEAGFRTLERLIDDLESLL